MSSETSRPSRLRSTGPTDRCKMLVEDPVVTEALDATAPAEVTSPSAPLTRPVRPFVNVLRSVAFRLVRAPFKEPPVSRRWATRESRLPSKFPGPECAVMSRQMALVSTCRPSRFR